MGTEHQRKAGEDFMKKIVLALAFVLWGSFVISGSDEAVTLIEATGTYIGIECENFTGNIELNIEL